jgi:biotin operon repressor
MIFCNHQEERLMEYLQHYKSPKSSNEIAAYIGMGNRATRAMISHLRAAHHIAICSTTRDGYFLAYSRSSADSTIAQLKARQRELGEVIDGIEAGLDEKFGWPCLFDADDMEGVG